MTLLIAVYHLLRARLYWMALAHVGHTHPDASLLTRRAAESQRILDRFGMTGTV